MMIKKAFTLLLAILLISVIASKTTYASSSSIIGPEIVYKDTLSILTIDQILEFYKTDSNEKVTVLKDNYTGFGDIPGVYNIQLITDVSTYSVNVHVIQNLYPIDSKTKKPILYAITKTNGVYTLYLTKENIITPQQVSQIAVSLDLLRIPSTTQVYITTNQYKNNETTPGKYMIEFRAVDRNGNQQFADFDIVVLNYESLNPDFVIGDDSVSFKNILIYSLSSLIIITILILVFNKKRKV